MVPDEWYICHEYFKRVNPKISPNPVVEEIFTEYIDNGDSL